MQIFPWGVGVSEDPLLPVEAELDSVWKGKPGHLTVGTWQMPPSPTQSGGVT